MRLKLLIVEDDRDARENLSLLLKQEFPDAAVESAEAVDIALALIDIHEPFDIAILDFRLPISVGLSPSMGHRSMCNRIREKSKNTIVFHFSAYLEDAEFKQHLEDVHMGENDPLQVFDKNDTLYPDKIVNTVKKYWYGQQIAVKMSDLLGVKEVDARIYRWSVARRFSLTNELADLFTDIVEYWDYLDESLREAIRNNLNLDNKDHPTRVSLL